MHLSTPVFWRKRSVVAWLLFPVSVFFGCVVRVRRWCYRQRFFKSWQSPVPVVVVGNITAGGAGKTPLVIALVKHLQKQNRKVALITRGYGGRLTADEPVVVQQNADAADVGDEALLLTRRTGATVVACRHRVKAVKHLLSVETCDVIICDDGLQHYALQRDIEIVVVDSHYRFGNRFLLPAGPLREPVSRLNSADLIVHSGATRSEPGYTLQAECFVRAHDNLQMGVAAFVEHYQQGPVNAVAAIAHPDKFFTTLTTMGLQVGEHPFPDHYAFQPKDLEFGDKYPVVMTEKDFMKCQQIAGEDYWYLKVSAEVDAIVLDSFDQQLHKAEQRSRS